MDDDDVPTLGVLELLEEQFLVTHMACLRLFVGLWRLHEQRETFRRRHASEETEDERDLREEFETELANLHELLTCETLRSVDVLEAVQAAIVKYLPAWPGASEAIERWWSPRQDKAAVMQSDLLLVLPGLWIGSDATLAPKNDGLRRLRRIRHIVQCDATPIDADDDFLHGAQRAKQPVPTDGDVSPIIETRQREDNAGSAVQHHRIVLFALGHMEFLVRRRDRTLPRGTSRSLDQVSRYLQTLLENLRTAQDDDLAALRTHHVEYTDQLDSVLVVCATGSRASVVVCVALLMRELQVSYAVALRVLQCARRHAAPSEYFDHVLRGYDDHLHSHRDPETHFPRVANGIN